MNVSSSLAARLGVKNQKLARSARSGKLNIISRMPTKSTSGLGGSLAHRLSVPVSSVGSSLSVGIKARLGLGPRRPFIRTSAAGDDQFLSPHPSERGLSAGAISAERSRKNIRTADLAARRGIQEGGLSRAVLPARVKMSSGRVVGGMRADLIRENSVKKKKRQQSSSPRRGTRPVVAMDATRGLTVSLQNSRRQAPYSQHDDRAPLPSHRSRGFDWDTDEEEEDGLQFRGARSHGVYSGEAVDSSLGVYNASLLFTTRTTTHHHHHHHHGPPSPSPPPVSSRPAVAERAWTPTSPYPRDRSPRQGGAASGRYLSEGRYLPQENPYYSEDYSPPPPPLPPIFHPRNRNRESPPPKSYSPNKGVRTAPKPTKAIKAAKRTKVVKPPKKSKKVKAVKILKSKKLKQTRSRRSSSLDTVSSNSDSSGRSSASDSSTRPPPASYRPPKERLLPEPHKQVLDPEVRESIASLQGKDLDSKSGPGPGIKDLVFLPSRTSKSLNQRFTLKDPSR